MLALQTIQTKDKQQKGTFVSEVNLSMAEQSAVHSAIASLSCSAIRTLSCPLSCLIWSNCSLKSSNALIDHAKHKDDVIQT